MEKIRVDNVIKVFGKNTACALQAIKAGKGRKEIFANSKQLVAVNNVSFSVNEGEILIIIGLSGSGKSTLLRCLNRLIEPDAGSIVVDGIDIRALSEKELRKVRQQKFGMVFQHFALFPHYSVLRNAAFGLELMGVPLKKRNERARVALERVNLTRFADAMPDQLSGGMQQRVGLARALALDAEILLMDEAFSALDPLTRREMQDELLRLQDELKKTIIFITHDLDEALNLGDRIILMSDGEVVQNGTAEEILDSPANDYVAGFVSHVDRSKVLTAGAIMEPPYAVMLLGVDGPRTALHKMRARDVSVIFVVDQSQKLIGIAHEEDLNKLCIQKIKDISPVVQRDIKIAHMDDPLAMLTNDMASLPYPMPVVDDKKRLRGVIIRGMMLNAFSADTNNDSTVEEGVA